MALQVNTVKWARVYPGIQATTNLWRLPATVRGINLNTILVSRHMPLKPQTDVDADGSKPIRFQYIGFQES